NTFLIDQADLGVLEFLHFRRLLVFLHLFVFHDYRWRELGHFYLGRRGRSGRGRGRWFLLLLLLHVLQLHLLHYHGLTVVRGRHAAGKQIGAQSEHDQRRHGKDGNDQPFFIPLPELVSTIFLVLPVEYDVENVGV